MWLLASFVVLMGRKSITAPVLLKNPSQCCTIMTKYVERTNSLVTGWAYQPIMGTFSLPFYDQSDEKESGVQQGSSAVMLMANVLLSSWLDAPSCIRKVQCVVHYTWVISCFCSCDYSNYNHVVWLYFCCHWLFAVSHYQSVKAARADLLTCLSRCRQTQADINTVGPQHCLVLWLDNDRYEFQKGG